MLGSMWKRRASLVVWLALGAYAVTACDTYSDSLKEGLKRPSGRVQVPPSEWGSGVGWWSTKLPSGCVSAGLPTEADRPAAGSTEDLGPITFAISSMAMGSRDRAGLKTPGAWRGLGMDLDGMCTRSETCEGQELAPCKTAGAGVPEDGAYCRDNTFGKMEAEVVAGQSSELGLSNDGFNCALCNGDYNLVFRITGYNGQLDDDRIRIDIYPSGGIDRELDWQCVSGDEVSWHQHDQECWWKTNEDFTLSPDGLAPQAAPPGGIPNAVLYDQSAYVREGYVVARLPADALFWFPGSRAVTLAFPLKLQGGIVVGKLAKDEAGAWKILDGTVAGRARRSDLLDGFRQLGMCEDHPLWGLAQTTLRMNMDLLASGAMDEEAECDAMSVGIGFEARQAKVSGKVAPVSALPGCSPPPGDGGVDGGAEAGTDAGVEAGADAAEAGGDGSDDDAATSEAGAEGGAQDDGDVPGPSPAPRQR